MLPRITLVTPSFNQGRFLAETIESVLAQGYPNLEYFVLDGGSTDGSSEIIHRYSPHIAYSESAPDRGQTDAIAKGFARSSGVLFNWLNSDDLLAPGALRHVAEMHRQDEEAGIYAAAVENFHDGELGSRHEKVVPQNLDLPSIFFRSGRCVHRHQPGIFLTSDLIRRAGGFRERYHMCMDVDIHARALASGGRVVYSDRTVAHYRRHAAAKTNGASRNTLRTVQEYIEITEEVGRGIGLQAHHLRGHGKTLLGAIRHGVRTGDWWLCREATGLLGRIAVDAVRPAKRRGEQAGTVGT